MTNHTVDTSNGRERHVFTHEEAGQVYVDRFDSNFPTETWDGKQWTQLPRPYFCNGRYYSSPEEAFKAFSKSWKDTEPSPWDEAYARLESSQIAPGVFEE